MNGDGGCQTAGCTMPKATLMPEQLKLTKVRQVVTENARQTSRGLEWIGVEPARLLAWKICKTLSGLNTNASESARRKGLVLVLMAAT